MTGKPFPLTRDGWLKRTLPLSIEARGAYLELALAAWVAEGPLPATELRHIARVNDRRVWTRVWPELERLLTGDVEHGYTDPWLETVRDEMVGASEYFSSLGKLSAAARRQRHGTAQPERRAERATERRSLPNPLPPRTTFDAPPPEMPERTLDAISGLAPVLSERPVQSPDPNRTERTYRKEQKEQGRCPDLDAALGVDADQAVANLPRYEPVDPHEHRPNIAVLTKLAHTLMDECDARAADPTWLTSPNDIEEEFKTRAGRAGLAYDGTSVRKALESAEWQRPRQTPFQCAVRLLRELVTGAGVRGLPADTVRNQVYALVESRYPSDAFLEWRDEVVRLAWEEQTWRAAPGVLEYTQGHLRVPVKP